MSRAFSNAGRRHAARQRKGRRRATFILAAFVLVSLALTAGGRQNPAPRQTGTQRGGTRDSGVRAKRVSERAAARETKKSGAAKAAALLPGAGSPLLAAADFDLIGLAVTAGPETQSVPKNTPTIVLTSVRVPPGTDPTQIIANLNPNFRVRGELTGPSLTAPLNVEAPIGQPLSVPPLTSAGDHVIQNLRVVDAGAPGPGELVVTSVTPDACVINVFDRLLITQVQVNELSHDEILQAGIRVSDDSYTAFNFTLALATTSGTQSFSIPAAFPNISAPDPRPILGEPQISAPGIDVPYVYPIMLTAGDDGGGGGGNNEGDSSAALMYNGGRVNIPGVLVVPGQVGFLHQFFEAIVIVANGAPNGAPLVITHLKAKARLPNSDTPADSTDDPLRIAETQTGGRVSELDLHSLGDDGKYGTADDAVTFAPGQTGQASFLLEGLKEGMHTVVFDLEGTLEGLPTGPITVRGEVPGAVLVRDASFAVTFTHPSVVRAGQEYDLALTLYNSGGRDIQGAFAQLSRNSINGAQLLAGDDGRRQFKGTIPRGEPATVKWRLRANTTGKVTASYVKVGDDIGAGLNLVTGVGDRNVPLSPDSLVLPEQVEKLPPTVVEAARELLGQAWSIANAPAGSRPVGVAPVLKRTVMDRAAELGVAGVRVDFGEPVGVSLDTLLRDWLGELEGGPNPGFADAERNTPAGYKWFDSIGTQLYERLNAAPPATDIHREFADAEMGRSPFISALLTQAPGEGVAGARLVDAQGARVGFGASVGERFGDMQEGAVLQLSAPESNNGPTATSGQMLVVSNPGTDPWTLELTGWRAGAADLSLIVPATSRTYSRLVWSGVQFEPGKKYRVNFRPSNLRTTPVLEEFRDGSYVPAGINAALTTLDQPPPRVVGAMQVTPEVLDGGDKYGRLVGVLFSKPMLKDTTATAARYKIGGGALKNSPTEQVGLPIKITGATLNFGDRLVFLALDSPVGPYIERDVTMTGLADARRLPLDPSTSTARIVPRVSPEGNPFGAYLTGRVLSADGTPVNKALVIYWTQECPNFALALPPPPPKPIATRYTDEQGRYEIDYVRSGDCAPLSVTATHPVSQSEKRLTSPVAYDGQHMSLDLVFLARGNVRGLVSSGGSAIANALVKVVPELDVVGTQVVQTDAAGRYEAKNVPVGHVSVTAIGTGTTANASGFAAGTIEGSGQTATINVSMQDVSGTIRGRVVRADGSPSPGSLVIAYAAIPGFPVNSFNGLTGVGFSYTDRDGTFIINGLPIGNIRLEVIDYVNGLDIAQSVQLTQANREASGILITLPPGAGGAGGGNVSGTVVNDIGLFVPAAVVSSGGRTVRADAQGNFTLLNLVPGQQNITAFDPATGIRGGTSVLVQAGETTQGVNVVLTRPAKIQGTVFLVAEGTTTPAPAVGVRVTVDGKAIVSTDEQGRYTLSNVTPNRRFTLRFVDPSKGLAINNDVTLRPGDTLTRDATFRPGRINGKVFQPDGLLGTGADILLFAQRPRLEQGADYGLLTAELPLTTQAATDGTYELHNLNPGKYRVSASNVFFPVAVSAGGVLQPSGAEVCNLTLVSTLAGKIQGRVFRPDGTTPVGAGLNVTLGGGSLADATVRTDENGHYEFAEVFSAGTYTLTALDPSTGHSNRVYISVEKNKDAIADVRLLGRGALRVRVVDGAGAPATSGSVTLDGASFPSEHRFAEITPASGGRIQFDDLPEGAYGLSATQHGLGGRASATVPLNSNAEVTVQLQASGTVEGRVFMPGGTTPIGLADVSLQLNGRMVGFAVTSDTAPEVGKFSFPDVPTGEFTLDVFDNRTGRVGRSAGRITTQGETATVNVELLPIGTVTGRVTANGNPVDHAIVRINADGSGIRGASLSATTDPEGLYRFNGIPAGRFQVSVTNGPGGLTGSAMGTVSGTNEPLPPTVVDIALEPSQTVTGTVFKYGGTEPLPGARINVRSSRGNFQTATREDGSYRLDFVPLGEVRVRAEGPTGFDRGEVPVATGTQAGATLNVNVTLSGTGAVAGDAFSHSGARLSSGRVTFTNDAWETPVIVNATVQPDGRYLIEGVPVGHFTLKLTVPSVVGVGAAVGDVVASQTVEVPVRLEDAGRVTGRVKTESGTSAVVGAGVVLTLVRANGQTVRFYSHTDAQGLWAFENIPLGAITVAAYDAASPGVALVSGVALNANGQTLDVGDMLLDNTPLRVVSVTPASGALNQPTNTPVTVTFSEAALSSSVNSESIQLFKGVERLSATVSLSADGLTATVTPSNRLTDSSAFALVVTTEVSDLVGHPLPDEFRSTFTTADETAPAVLSITPAAGSFEVPVTTDVVATFGEELERSQDLAAVLKLTAAGSPVAGSFTLDDTGKVLTFRLASALGESTRYTVAVTGQLDAAGNAQTSVASVQFTTFNPPPAIVVTNPAEGAQLAENQTIELAADATDNTAVAQVVFNVNGAQLPPVTSAPYVRTYTVPTGSTSLTVSATATDDLGKTTTSPERTVSVTSDPGATIAGTVTNMSGQTIASAQVTLNASNGTFNTQTDAAGRYRFDNAGIGPVVIQVFDPASNLRGRGALSVSSFSQTFTLDVRLVASGVVTGTVFSAGGTTPLAGAQVSLTTQGGGVLVGTVTTDGQGRYTIDYVPLGNFRLDVNDPATGDRGAATNQLNANGETRTVNVTMNGLGSVVVTVRGSSNQLVADAQVSLTSLSTFGGTQTGTTASDGTATFERVLAGNIYVSASDPATRLGGAATGSLAAGATANVAVRLEPAGTISGRVFDVDGTTPLAGVTVRLLDSYYYNSVVRQATSETDGSYRFDYVPLNTYNLDALDGEGRVRARSNGAALTTNGQTVTRDLTFIGLGAVAGHVLNPDGTPAPGLQVSVRSTNPIIGGFFNATTNAEGEYIVSGLPVGAFTASAADDSRQLQGETNGQITQHGQTATADIRLLDNAVNLPLYFYDANSFFFDMQGNGSIGYGTSLVYAGDYYSNNGGFLLDLISGGVSNRFAGGSLGTKENDGRQVTVREQNPSGLNVTRKVYVPREGYFARYLEVLSNPTDSPVTVDVRVQSNLGSYYGGVQQIVNTSSGDAVPSVGEAATADRWLVVDDGLDADPFLNYYSTPAAAFIYDGPNGAERAGAIDFAITNSARRELSYRWNNVTVAPGATVAFLHFGVQQTSRAAARASAERLVQLPPEALAGLTRDEIAAVRNFAVPADGTSSLAPLPALNGTVTGRLLASDNTTTVPGGQVQFKSNNLLFGRTHFTNSDGAGSYNFTASFNDFGGTVAIPVDDFTVSAQHPQTGAQSPNFTGAFAEGQTTATRDITFSNTGLVHGVVRRHTGQPVTSGYVQLSIYFRFGYATVPIAADGSYSFNGVPAGNYTVTAFVANQQGTALTANANVRVTAGQAATADISIQPTGAVTGIVRDAAGNPSTGRLVTLSTYGFTRQTTTDASGRYMFGDVPVGNFNVETYEPRTFIPATAQVSVAQDQTTELDLMLIGVGQVEAQVNYASGSGVSFTPVYLQRANSGYYFVGYTDAGGHLTVFNVPVGDFNVLSYNPNNFNLSATASGNIASDGGTASVVVQLPGTGVVNGRVTFPDGAPAVNAVVEISGYNVPTQSVGTDSAGNYSFGQVVAGREFTIRAHNPNDSVSYRDAANKSLTRDGETLTLDLTLPASATLRVTVLKSDGGAYANAQVNLRDAFRPYLRYVGNTDASGVLLVPRVPEGDFSLQAYDPETGAPRGSTSGTVTAADHGRTLDVTINAPRAGTVSGTVFAGDGQTPMTGLNLYVEVIDVATEQVLTYTYTNSNTAAYRVENVAPGDRGFRVRASHYRFSGAGEADGNIVNDGDTVAVNVTMPVSVIKGTVTFHDGAPVPYPSIYVTQPGAEGDNTFYSYGEDEQGHYVVYGAAVGDFVATTQSSEFGLTASVNGSVTDISVPAILNISLPPTGTVTGRVLRRDGAGNLLGVPSTRVKLTIEGGAFRRDADTDAEGNYTFERVAPGPLTLEAEDPNNSGLIGRATATLTAAGEIINVNITLPDSGTVGGTVFSSDGTTPAAHASVVITSPGLSYERYTTADQNGVYQFASIPLGPYSLQAVDTSQYPYTYGWRGGELASVNGQSGADITILATGTVSGKVLGADGNAVAGAQVRVRGFAGSGLFGSFNYNTATDANGNYEVAGAPVGRVRVSAVDPVDYNVVGFAEGSLTGANLAGLDVTLGNAFRWPFYLDGADGFRYDVYGNGELNAGGSTDGGARSYYGAYYLALNGAVAQPYFDEGTSDEGRQARVGTFGAGGLYVTRKVFSPTGGGFARYLEVLTNPTGADITVNVRADHYLYSYNATRVVVAPSQTANRYALTDGGVNAGSPALAFVFAGPGAATAASAARFTDGNYYQTYSWNVTIPAGQTRALMHFAVQRAANDGAGAQAQAQALVNLTDPHALDYLSAAEKSQVVNFQIP